MEHLHEILLNSVLQYYTSFRSFSILIYGYLKNNKMKGREKGQEKELGAGILNSVILFTPLPFSLHLTFLLPHNKKIFILDQNIYLTYSQYPYKTLINTAIDKIFYSSFKKKVTRGRKTRKKLSKLMISRPLPAHGFYF